MRGTAVLKHAVLRGMQQEVSCDVLVHMRPAGFEPRFSEGFVLNAPPTLPDGEYSAHFDGNTMLARKEKGRWLYSNNIEGPSTSQPEEYLDRAQLIERYATVASQLHNEQGDREALLIERAQLIERGKKMGLFQTLSASPGDTNTRENTVQPRG